MSVFEKTQEQLDTLRNLTWQNGKLIEQIEKLTKMLEEKEDSALVAEIEEAKKVLADAINTKGGSASADSSFSKLAEDVLSMPTSGILANGVTQTEPFSFLKYITTDINNEITEIYDTDITEITRHYAFYNNIALREAVMTGVTSISVSNVFQNCLSLQSVQLPNLVTISGNSVFFNCNALQTITFGVLVVCLEPFSNQKQNLRNITIGENTDIDLPFQNWTATSVIAEGQSGIDELNDNLYNNLITKLYDHSQDGQTRTLRLGWLAKVSQENIDYANSKGWTLTT